MAELALLKLGRQFVLSLRTILVRYDFDDNTPIDSGAEGGCFAKGTDVEFTPHRASHESHSIPGLKKRYSASVLFMSVNRAACSKSTRRSRSAPMPNLLTAVELCSEMRI